MSKSRFVSLFILSCITLSLAQCNIWDNILSQTEASHPIMLTESFNIEVSLPEKVGLNVNIDFNSELKIITVKLSKNLFIQKVQFIKAQINLESLMINVNQFLLGCEKFTFALEDQTSGEIKKTINGVNISKKQLFLVNLFFKYIGKYQSKNNGSTDQKKDNEAGILDIFKGNKIFDSIIDSGVFGDVQKAKSLTEQQQMNVFEFSIDFYKDPSKLIDQIKKAKQVAKDEFQIEEGPDFDLDALNLDMIKFVIVTEGKTGEIVKAFKNKDMKEELELSLKSKETQKQQCQKEAKKLTVEDLSNGAKYLYENKDSFGDILG